MILGIRPEDLEDAELARDIHKEQRIRGRVELREALGSEIMVHFSIAARPAITDETASSPRTSVRSSSPWPSGEGTAMMVGRFGARSRVTEGDEISIAVDTRSLHFFDPETGLGIYDEDSTKGARE